MPTTLQPGDTLGRYRVERLLGTGAMGEVYLARDPQIDRPLALKTLRLAGVRQEELGERHERLLREARTAGRLIHPHIVTLFDAGEEEGLLYLAFEYVPGSDLSVRLQGGPLPVGEALRIARETCAGLGHAHRHGIVHRDVKPSNLLLDGNGRVKISDFGIAKISNETSELTVTGTVMGSPHYMSPEQIRGEELDGRSDLFSLGVVLYEMISGRRPFAGETLTTLVYQILSTEPPELPPLAPGLDPRLPRLVEALMHKDRDERLPDAATAAAEIAALEGELPEAVLAAPAHHGTGPTDRTRPLPASGAQDAPSPSPPSPPPPPPPPSAPMGAAAPVPPPPPPSTASSPAPREADPPGDGASPPADTGGGTYAVPSLGGGRRIALVLGLVALVAVAGLLALALLRGGEGRERQSGAERTPVGEEERMAELPQPGPETDAGPGSEGGAPPSSRSADPTPPVVDPPNPEQETTEPLATPPRQEPDPPTARTEEPSAGAAVSDPPPNRDEDEAAPEPVPGSEPKSEPEPDSDPEPVPPVQGTPVQAAVDTGLRVHFDVMPPDAFVLVDGTVIGRAVEFASRGGAPYTLPGAGVHRVTLRRDGMEDVHLVLDADAGRSGVTPVRARMGRLAAAETPLHELQSYRVREGVALRVDPPTTRVLVDGVSKGMARRYSGGGGPFRRGNVLELPPGVHRVTLMAPGRQRVDFAVDVTAGATRDRQRVEMTLPRLPVGGDG